MSCFLDWMYDHATFDALLYLPGHILDLYCIQLSNTAPFCKNYATLYFDAKYLEKGLKGGEGVKFLVPFFFKKKSFFYKKVPFLANIKCCPKFLEYACLLILWIYTCQALLPLYQKDLDVCFMQQVIKFTEVSHMWFFAGTVIWYHTQRHTAHSGTSKLTDPYKYIFTSPVMCSQQLPLLHWMNNSLISKIYFQEWLFFSKFIQL